MPQRRVDDDGLTHAPAEMLTWREFEILELIASPRSDEEIAAAIARGGLERIDHESGARDADMPDFSDGDQPCLNQTRL